MQSVSADINIRVEEGVQALDAVAGEWDQLVTDSPSAVFARPKWLKAWIEAFAPRRITIITAWHNTRLVGVLPLALIRADMRGLYFNRVAPLAPGITDYQSPIVQPGLAGAVFPLMIDRAVTIFGRGKVYWWPNVPIDDPAFAIMIRHLADQGGVVQEERERAPRLQFRYADYAEEERSWSRSHRGDVNRQRRRLSARAGISLWQPSTLVEHEELLNEYFAVHDEKWHAQNMPGRFQDPKERAHFRGIVRHLWNDGLYFSTLRCGDVNVSYHFGFMAGGWLLSYRPAYRLAFANYSPSKVHVSLLIEEGYRLGWSGLDFLLGEEGYKMKWSNDARVVSSLHCTFRSVSPSYQWFTRGKPLTKKYLFKTVMRFKAFVQTAGSKTPKWKMWR